MLKVAKFGGHVPPAAPHSYATGVRGIIQHLVSWDMQKLLSERTFLVALGDVRAPSRTYSIPGSSSDRKTHRQLAVEKLFVLALRTPTVCKDRSIVYVIVFICLNSRWSDSSFPLNSVEKDLNWNSHLSTTIGCRFRVSLRRSCCTMASRR